MREINKIHDKFFQKIFADEKNVKIFLKSCLSEKISKHIDFNSIKIDRSSYISEKYKGYYSDVVVKTKIKQIKDKQADIYILFEHKSYKDKKIFIQLLRYMYLMWEVKNEKNNIRYFNSTFTDKFSW